MQIDKKKVSYALENIQFLIACGNTEEAVRELKSLCETKINNIDLLARCFELSLQLSSKEAIEKLIFNFEKLRNLETVKIFKIVELFLSYRDHKAALRILDFSKNILVRDINTKINYYF